MALAVRKSSLKHAKLHTDRSGQYAIDDKGFLSPQLSKTGMEGTKGPHTAFSAGKKWVFQTEAKIPSRVEMTDVNTDFTYGVLIKMKDDAVTIKA